MNQKAQLSEKIFSKIPETSSTRDGYGQGLLEIGKEENVVVLSADLEESTRAHWFKKIYPKRYFEMGISEQNMVGVAAGMAVSGKIPFINSYAVFSPGRNWEQIRTLCAYNNANVKIAGHHAGLLTGADGATHQALEDIALMRALPNMKVVVPCDAIEAQKATVAAAALYGPTYIRLQREKTPVITTKETPFVFGKIQTLWEPKKSKCDVVIFGIGPVIYDALHAAKELEKQKISVAVINVSTIKPLDEKGIAKWLKDASVAVTVEEHSVIGGLGSAIAELASKTTPLPIEFVGTQDVFGQSGKPHELLKYYGITAKHIVSAAQKAHKRR